MEYLYVSVIFVLSIVEERFPILQRVRTLICLLANNHFRARLHFTNVNDLLLLKTIFPTDSVNLQRKERYSYDKNWNM